MSVTFLRPKNMLKEALSAPGGIKVSEALANAAENLKELAGPARDELGLTLTEAEGLFAGYGAAFDEAKTNRIYDLANKAVGLAALCGHPALDHAVVSLCDLLDRLKTRRAWDTEAVGVHIYSLRLLLGAKPGDPQVEKILGGLRKVSAKYA